MADSARVKIKEFQAQDGVCFPLYFWQGDVGKRETEKAQDIVILHGMGSAPSEMALLAETAQSCGINAWCYAMRNQGLDPRREKRGKTFEVAEIVDDFRQFLLQEIPTEKKVLLAGESMGGIFALSLMLFPEIKNRVTGIILLSPVIHLRQKLSLPLEVLVRVVYKIMPNIVISPALFVHGRSEKPQLTTNKIYEQENEKRPHTVKAYALGFTVQVGKLMKLAQKIIPKINQPILMLAGKHDPFIDPKQLREEFEKFASTDKKFIIFENTYHLIQQDDDADAAKKQIAQWIQEHG
ncbi:MAG: alpha/beta hydrolase [Chthoniobacterales bacterium]